MLTQLNTHKPLNRNAFVASPPNRALANYAKASLSKETAPTDTVELSERAKSNPSKDSTMRKVGTYVALGLSFMGIMGAVGCSGTAATASARPEAETVQDSVQSKSETVELRKEQKRESVTTQKPGQNLLDGVTQEGKKIKDAFKGKSAEEIAETVGQEGRKVGEEVVRELKSEGKRLKETFKGKNAEEIAETVGQEAAKVGKQLGEEGKKIGQDAAKVGKEIGKVAKGFWRGVTGKNKK